MLSVSILFPCNVRSLNLQKHWRLPLNSSLVFLNAFLQPFPEVLQQSLSTPMDPLLLLLTPVNRSQLFHSLCIVLKLSCILTVLLPNILSIFLPFNMDMLYIYFFLSNHFNDCKIKMKWCWRSQFLGIFIISAHSFINLQRIFLQGDGENESFDSFFTTWIGERSFLTTGF